MTTQAQSTGGSGPIIGTGSNAQGQSTVGGVQQVGFTSYVVHDSSSGKIMKYGRARDYTVDGGASMTAQCGSGQAAVAVSQVPDPALYYVSGGVVTARPACPITQSISARVLTLSSVPHVVPYVIYGSAGSTSGTTDSSGTLAITFPAAGTYEVQVTCFPSQDFDQSYTVT